MFGTIALMKPKQGREQDVVTMLDRWWTERRPNIKGAIASTIYRNVSNPSELMMAVVFDSKENYTANAQDPEQNKWYQELAALLDGEPRWIDGDVLDHHHA